MVDSSIMGSITFDIRLLDRFLVSASGDLSGGATVVVEGEPEKKHSFSIVI